VHDASIGKRETRSATVVAPALLSNRKPGEKSTFTPISGSSYNAPPPSSSAPAVSSAPKLSFGKL
jgi:hypothetical protein